MNAKLRFGKKRRPLALRTALKNTYGPMSSLRRLFGRQLNGGKSTHAKAQGQAGRQRP